MTVIELQCLIEGCPDRGIVEVRGETIRWQSGEWIRRFSVEDVRIVIEPQEATAAQMMTGGPEQ